MSHSPLLQLEHFTFSFEEDEKPVINDLSFQINEGESVLLMGASGSGKSTLALCLNGLYPEAVEGISSGDLYFRGININEFKKGELNQQIGIVFQDPESQFCMIKVEDELAFTLENLSIPRKEMVEKIDHVLDLIGMKPYKQSKIHELSGGQKQKIALAAVLLMEPKLLILDEPTANLDPVSSLEFIELIGELQAKSSMSIVVIEHQADDWVTLIDRVLVLDQEGQLTLDGNPSDVFQTHAEQFKQEGLFLPQDFSGHQSPKQQPSPIASTHPCMTINHLSFTRKNKTILDELTFKIYPGKLMAIVGQNGAGKSTLLQLMARLLKPKHGSITFEGLPLHEWNEPKLRQRTGFVFQNPEHQFITDTVYDEIAFGLRLNNESEEKVKTVVQQLLNTFHLSEQQWRNPFSLSGGQKRRLSVATMLDETPDLLLFDEPTFGQDAYTTQELMNMIMNLKQKGTAIVFVTHDINLVDQYADRVMVLNEGKIAHDGIPERLWQDEDLLKEARLRKPYRLERNEVESIGLIH
ncbi:energy-coupling factor transport system ATP-binding protein [Aquisalibacillus elongatus]|uniref:Energy-coupling factor transport system ATP-binding protein n=2 Tax=Aquisalibacillus elongatus TaxID=485577 RepID=A0A3N5C1J3_9BACI|nr:ABC transporter ATP-binding protein [Aquisalibacillus elongatus]RPF53252.1 energy-coupling factor transport system ATP-binding protein [Aquisalibacillus elongatus]